MRDVGLGEQSSLGRSFFRLDSHGTSKEVCFIQTYTRESRSDSVDMLYVPKVRTCMFIPHTPLKNEMFYTLANCKLKQCYENRLATTLSTTGIQAEK